MASENSKMDAALGSEALYQPVEPSSFATAFWDFYNVFWEAEARFDLVFRRDHGVAVWTANRVRTYYDLARQLGLYDEQATVAQAAPAPAAAEQPELAPLGTVDVYIQTSAVGPAAANRVRHHGCVYTAPTVKRLLDDGRRLLLVHDAPEALVPHPALKVITTAELRARARAASGGARAPRITFDEGAQAYWGEVARFFEAELGVIMPHIASLETRVAYHKQQLAWHQAFLADLSPNAFICTAHYFRAPQIEAARRLKIHTIDYQHGINSRYHLGYGYPNLKPEARLIPYFPDEFWSWGEIWTDRKWFPDACCAVRHTGHPVRGRTCSATPFDERPEKTVLVASSWAMQSAFRKAISNMAGAQPDWTVRVKLHPREHVSQYADLAATYSNIEIIPGDVDVVEAAGKVRYVLSICSSSLFDVLLVDCRIGVIQSHSVEYAEDFATRFGVPVLEADAGNFSDVIADMARQAIPLKAVFHVPGETELTLMSEALSIPRRLIWLPPRGRMTTRLAKRLWGSVARTARHYKQVLLARTTPLSDDHCEAPRLVEMPRARIHSYRPARLEAERLARRVADGENPARLAGKIRTTLAALGTARGDHAAARHMLAAIEADTQPSADCLRAELFEAGLCAGLHGGGRRPDAHAPRLWPNALDELANLAPALGFYAEIYTNIAARAEQEFGDGRVAPTDRRGLQDALRKRLDDPEPFSMLRVGDGEVYAFDPGYCPADVLEEDRKIRENIWWQTTIDEALRARMRHLAIDAICEADFLGVPSAFRLLRDLPRLLPKMRGPIASWHRKARAHRVLFEELRRLADAGRLDWSGKTLIDDRCHQGLFTPRGLRAFEVPDRPRVLVNCFPYDQVNAALGQDFFTAGVRLPPHSKVSRFVPDDALAKATTPYVLDDLIDQVRAQAARGAVLFVAGGFVGKILIGQSRAAGGAALDIGAAADYWLGYETRGPLDFREFRKGTK